MPRTSFGKRASVENPYAIYKGNSSVFGEMEYRVLKTYKHSSNEDRYSRAFVAGRSDATHGSWEYGDTYLHEMISQFNITYGTDQWYQEYHPDLYMKSEE